MQTQGAFLAFSPSISNSNGENFGSIFYPYKTIILKKITISIESKKIGGYGKYPPILGCKSLLRDCTYRANACTCTAIQASVSVNVELTFALRNCANRALACTGTAGNAVIADFVSHCVLLFLRIK